MFKRSVMALLCFASRRRFRESREATHACTGPLAFGPLSTEAERFSLELNVTTSL